MGLFRLACLARLVGSWIALCAMACDPTDDPTSPCAALDVRSDPQLHSVGSSASPLLAWLGAVDGAIVYPVHEAGQWRLVRARIPGLGENSEIVVTSSGQFVVILEGGQPRLHVYALTAQGPEYLRAVTPAQPPTRLVATLRNSNWLLYRDDQGTLRRFDVAAVDRPTFEVVADARLKVIAVGEHAVVLRETLADDRERVLVRSVDGTLSAGDARAEPLLVGDTFSAVAITPDDRHVIVTHRDHADAETFVFALPNRRLLHRFKGGIAVGRNRDELDELPGLSAVSPDGSHLAYRTGRGSAALHDLDTGNTCLVRSAAGGEHGIVGFSNDGLLYLEAKYDTFPVAHQIFVRDLISGRESALGNPGTNLKLVAVPTTAVPSPQGDPARPWAVAISSSTRQYEVTQYYAVQPEAGQTAIAGLRPRTFLPRAEAAVWAISGEGAEDQAGRPTLEISLVRVVPHMTARGTIDFRAGSMAAPHVYDPDGTDNGAFKLEFVGEQHICLATGASGRWNARCGVTSPDNTDLFHDAPPETEVPPKNDPS